MSAIVLGHRGVMPLENTQKGLQTALNAGLDGAEIDLMLTRDRQVVVFHDPTLRRLAGRAEKVAHCDYRELAAIRLQNGELIPRLQEVLDAWPRNKVLNLELKEGGEALVESTKLIVDAACQTRLDRHHLIFSSFDVEMLRAARKLGYDYPLALLLEPTSPSKLLDDLGDSFAAQGVHLRASMCSQTLCDKIAAKERYLGIWGATSAAQDCELVQQRGATVVITDFPEKHPVLHAQLDPADSMVGPF